jgi:hypothetical protein
MTILICVCSSDHPDNARQTIQNINNLKQSDGSGIPLFRYNFGSTVDLRFLILQRLTEFSEYSDFESLLF